jgi:hypothetical protein
MYGQAMDALLFDLKILEHCRQNCYCPTEEDDRLYKEQREAMEKKGLHFDIHTDSDPFEGIIPRPSMNGRLEMSNQRDCKMERGKGKLGMGGAATMWPGRMKGPTFRVSGGKRPPSPTLNANGRARAVFGLGRVVKA